MNVLTVALDHSFLAKSVNSLFEVSCIANLFMQTEAH